MADIPITDEIHKAITAAISEAGGVVPFAKKIGVEYPTVVRYRGKTIKSMHQNTWEKMFPEIKKHLPGEGKMTVGDSNISFKGDNNSAQTGSGKNDLLLDLMEATLNDNSLSAEDKVKFFEITLKNRRK